MTTTEICNGVKELEHQIITLNATIRILMRQKEALRIACQNFVKKVDDGQAYSKQSYQEMKDALSL